MAVKTTYLSPLGEITLAGEGETLTGLWFTGQKHFGGEGIPAGEAPVFLETRRWLEAYFAGKAPGELPPLAPVGTPFQKAVWDLLLEIPRGETATYGQLAERLSRRQGRATSPRAVGSAVGRNPISLMIPCHRVVGAKGSLTGYAGGLERKKWLLTLEGAHICCK